jgi:hypothetical protein
MAKTIKAEDLNALFVKDAIVESRRKTSRAGFFDMDILNKATDSILKNACPIDANAFWNMAKIGEMKADDSHKFYYVTRAFKMAILNTEKKINLFDDVFNNPASTKIMQKHLNKKAFKLQNATMKDGTKTVLLNIDVEHLFN